MWNILLLVLFYFKPTFRIYENSILNVTHSDSWIMWFIFLKRINIYLLLCTLDAEGDFHTSRRIELDPKVAIFCLFYLKMCETSRKIIFNHDIFFVCLVLHINSNIHYNSMKEGGRKFVQMPKYVYFQNNKRIRFSASSQIVVIWAEKYKSNDMCLSFVSLLKSLKALISGNTILKNYFCII